MLKKKTCEKTSPGPARCTRARPVPRSRSADARTRCSFSTTAYRLSTSCGRQASTAGETGVSAPTATIITSGCLYVRGIAILISESADVFRRLGATKDYTKVGHPVSRAWVPGRPGRPASAPVHRVCWPGLCRRKRPVRVGSILLTPPWPGHTVLLLSFSSSS